MVEPGCELSHPTRQFPDLSSALSISSGLTTGMLKDSAPKQAINSLETASPNYRGRWGSTLGAEVSKVKTLSQISPLPVLMKSYWTPATPSYLCVVYDRMFEVVFTLPDRVEELRQGS